jgi:sugar lactone lactonase YvrE
MKSKLFKSLLIVSLCAPALARAAGDSFPEVILLPDGWGPEGIEVGRGTDFYAGARHTSPFAGAIYKGDLRTGAGDILVQPQPGRFALGLKLDQRSGNLFVAGGPGGAGFVYDGTTGADIASFQVAADPTFVNDVIVTRAGAYFTDSRQPVLYVVPLGPGGALPDSPPLFSVLPLSGDFTMAQGFNVNGIAATPNGEWLIIVQSNTGLLYRVDPQEGVATVIDLGGALVTSGDGIVLHGRRLYVCRNALNQIAIIDLDPSLSSGNYVGDIVSPQFRIPTTIARFGSNLYVVNARFDQPIPGTEYQIVQVFK